MEAIVRALEASIPVYEVRENDYGAVVTLVDGRSFFVDRPFEGVVVIAPATGSYEGDLALMGALYAELSEGGFDARRVVCRELCVCELRVREGGPR